jgi:hypothetical protein
MEKAYIFIVRMIDNFCVWNSHMINYKNEYILKEMSWHYLYNYMKDPANLDKTEVYVKAQIFDQDLAAVSSTNYYIARRIRAHDNPEMIQPQRGFELLLWDYGYFSPKQEQLEEA